MTSVPFFLLFFAVVVAFAIWRGGPPERMTAFAYFLALAGSATVGIIDMPGAFRVVPTTVFVVDVALLAFLCLIAIRANRWWPIPAAGCQLIAVLVHAGKLLDPAMIPLSYAFLVTIWSWPMVLLLGLGTWAHRRRLKDGSIVLDWKHFSMQRRSTTQSAQQTN